MLPPGSTLMDSANRDSLEMRLRRLVRRARAASRDVRHPRAALRSLRELRELRRRHPGLATDLSSDERPEGKHVLLVSLTDDLEQVRLEALLAKALQLRGAHVTVYVFRSSRAAVRLLRALGIRSLVFYEDFAPAGSISLEEAREAVAGCATVRDYKELEYGGARVGRQALSTVVRARHDPTIDLGSPDVRQEIARTVTYGIEGLHAGQALLDALAPDMLLMIERGYAGLGALSDLALNRGLPVIQFASAHRDDAFFLKRYNRRNRSLPQRSLDERTWEQLLAEGWSEEKEEELRAELAAQESGKWFLAKRLRHARRRRSPSELRQYLGLDEDREVAVLFSHVLWDASMFHGRDLYPDQGAWFRETVRLAAEDDRVQWLVKLHPALFWKLRTEGVAGEPAELVMIREAVGDLPPHARLLMPDDDVHNEDLFEIIDAGVTIRGTVGIELPQRGIPVLTAGTSDYAGRGFTVDADSVEEYEQNIRSIPELARLAPDQMRLAKLYAYGVFCRRPWLFWSFALDYLPPSEERQLLHRLRYNIRTEEELHEAADLENFARWVLESDEPDFLQSPAQGEEMQGLPQPSSATAKASR